jgi:hypothetical protein
VPRVVVVGRARPGEPGGWASGDDTSAPGNSRVPRGRRRVVWQTGETRRGRSIMPWPCSLLSCSLRWPFCSVRHKMRRRRTSPATSPASTRRSCCLTTRPVHTRVTTRHARRAASRRARPSRCRTRPCCWSPGSCPARPAMHCPTIRRSSNRHSGPTTSTLPAPSRRQPSGTTARRPAGSAWTPKPGTSVFSGTATWTPAADSTARTGHSGWTGRCASRPTSRCSSCSACTTVAWVCRRAPPR